MKQLAGVVFDCDGVLFESRRANLAYYNTVLAHLGEDLVAADAKEKCQLCHTACSRDVFHTLLGEERGQVALDYAGSLDYRQFIPYMDPEPGMFEALQALGSRYPLALATNRGSSAFGVLDHFGLRQLFDVVVTSHDVERPKPYPDMLELAVRRLDLETSEVLYVGDSRLDREASRQAGIFFAAYKGETDGDLSVGGFDELMSWIDSVS